MPACWNCGEPPRDVHFCALCGRLQPPPENYFDFFNLERKLGIDAAELDRRFYALSRRLHPDLFFRREERERGYSLEASAVLNDAYRTLKDPVRRAEYLLKENGFDVGEQKSSNVPPELLEEVFELNMALEESRGEEIQAALAKFGRMLGDSDRELERQFERYDASLDRAALADIRALLNRRKYIRNLIETAAGTR
jgi:molecular chaperone HscB